MTETYKRLGSIAPTDNKEYLVYITPAGTQSLVSNITVANRSSSSASFDINVYESGVTQDSDVQGIVPSGSSVFVSLSDAGTSSMYSTDAITWTASSRPISGRFKGVAYGENTFVALSYEGNTNSSMYSYNGISWQQSTLPSAKWWGALAHGDGKFVGLATYTSTQQGAISTNGISWTPITVSSAQGWVGAAYGNGRFVAISYDPPSTASTDGITWTAGTMPFGATKAVAYGSGVFVCVSYAFSTSNIASSTDGIVWTQRTFTTSRKYYTSIAYSSIVGKFVVVGYDSQIAGVSTDGITWAAATMPSSTSWTAIAYGSGVFAAVAANNGAAATSTDGITWTARTAASTTNWTSIVHGETGANYSSPSLNNLYKTSVINANETLILEPGVVLSASASIVAKDNSGGNLTISAYGVELS